MQLITVDMLRRLALLGALLTVQLLSTAIPVAAADRVQEGQPPDSAVASRITARDDLDGCQPADGERDELAEPGDPVSVGGVEVRLERLADTTVGSATLTAVVARADGEPLTGAMVFVTIRMPTMDHGESAYPADEVADGRYRVEDVSLGMGGAWVVTVEVIRQARAPVAVAYRVDIT